MIVFVYDKTFEGLLTAVFDAYFRKTFPDVLVIDGEPLPLFHNEVINVTTDEGKSNRVWKSLCKKMSRTALDSLWACWMSEISGVDMLLFRYICKNVDSPKSVEVNFGDPDVLEISKIFKKVSYEKSRVIRFIRFQKTSDDTYFGAIEPMYNVLPFTISHFRDRFGNQRWLVYDIKRQYGYYYDLSTVTEVRFNEKESHLLTGILNDELMAEDEKMFQQLWKQYFKSITIQERINPKLHKQNLPVRFWKYLTEKQK